jgi:dienelactone hydrolase
VTSSELEYDVNGTTMIGHLALPDGDGPRPGILVCHEGPGLTDGTRAKADRLAALGYVAFALDYHGGGQVITDRPAMMARLGELIGDPSQTRSLGRAGLDVLLAQPRVDHGRVAAIGYCFGGTMSLELARAGTDLHAVVGFHSGLATKQPQDAARITAKVLVCIGADDPMIPPAQRTEFEEEMRAAGVDWRMNVYGNAVHSFTNQLASAMGFPGIAYHRPTDERSWRAMLDLFDETFGPVGP